MINEVFSLLSLTSKNAVVANTSKRFRTQKHNFTDKTTECLISQHFYETKLNKVTVLALDLKGYLTVSYKGEALEGGGDE